MLSVVFQHKRSFIYRFSGDFGYKCTQLADFSTKTWGGDGVLIYDKGFDSEPLYGFGGC